MKQKPRAGKTDAYIGERLRAARLAASMTQTALADALGVRYQMVQRYEAGENRISAASLADAAAALGRRIAWFYPPEYKDI